MSNGDGDSEQHRKLANRLHLVPQATGEATYTIKTIALAPYPLPYSLEVYKITLYDEFWPKWRASFNGGSTFPVYPKTALALVVSGLLVRRWFKRSPKFTNFINKTGHVTNTIGQISNDL